MPAGDPTGFRQATRDWQKIMVVNLGFLGDTVYLIPVRSFFVT
jgi:23S rRNA maturation mini-RNase III